MGVIGKLVQMGTDINDRVIFDYLLGSAKGNAKAYLTAALVATAPELRSFFTSQLNLCINAHSALVALGTKKGWLAPTNSPAEILEKELKNTECLINYDMPEDISNNE
ncbi:MAG TPA: spore coat protein [Acholeplasmataceae bacterium]|jgi:spore coat protein CotF|nr:spore coat protein [Acholeplasmataceae bacterium]